MTRQHKAFTLIEVLIVIGVISLLATLVTLGVRHIGAVGRTNSTKITLGNLKNMITEKETAGGGLSAIHMVYQAPWPTPDQVVAPGDVSLGSTARIPVVNIVANTPPAPQNVVGATMVVMNLLKAVPANARAITALPTNQIMTGYTVPGFAAPIILDAWGNPIIYVPRVNPAVAGSGGMSGVATTGENGRPAYITVRSPDGRGFWASAGPDGVFSILPGPNGMIGAPPDIDDIAGGDDNVYSFEN